MNDNGFLYNLERVQAGPVYVIVEAIGEDGGLEIYYSGSEIAFPPEGMDGKWKPVPVPCECLRERG